MEEQSGARRDGFLVDAEVEQLIAVAAEARQAAYTPYSHFDVGAALLTADGVIYRGCNVENASYGLGVCAERNAVFHAVAEGVRRFVAVAVVTANGVTPCGACRQVLAEFNPEMIVIVANLAGARSVYRLSALLPDAFGPAHLGK